MSTVRDRLQAVRLAVLEAVEADRALGKALPLQHYLDRFPDHGQVVLEEWQGQSTAATEHQTPPWRILRALPRSGQARVFEAEYRGQRVALKVFHGRASETLPRLRREAKLLRTVEHPAVSKILATGETDTQLWLATEWVEGKTLTEWLETRKPPTTRFATEDRVRLAVRIGRAVCAAHAVGIVHRDIKPSNIMIRTDGEVVLIDFSLAKELQSDHSLTATGEILGTVDYCAPEQLLGQRVDARCDVFSLAATVCTLLTHRTPFDSAHNAYYRSRHAVAPISLREHNSAIPRWLAHWIERAMAADRVRRPASVAAWVAPLDAWLEGRLGKGRQAAWILAGCRDRYRRSPKMRMAVVLSAVGLTVAPLALALQSLRGRDRGLLDQAQARIAADIAATARTGEDRLASVARERSRIAQLAGVHSERYATARLAEMRMALALQEWGVARRAMNQLESLRIQSAHRNRTAVLVGEAYLAEISGHYRRSERTLRRAASALHAASEHDVLLAPTRARYCVVAAVVARRHSLAPAVARAWLDRARIQLDRVARPLPLAKTIALIALERAREAANLQSATRLAAGLEVQPTNEIFRYSNIHKDALLVLGHAQREADAPLTALGTYRRARDVLMRIHGQGGHPGQPIGSPAHVRHTVLCLSALGRHTEAEALVAELVRAQQWSGPLGHRLGIGECRLLLAKAASRRGQADRAQALAAAAVEEFEFTLRVQPERFVRAVHRLHQIRQSRNRSPDFDLLRNLLARTVSGLMNSAPGHRDVGNRNLANQSLVIGHLVYRLGQHQLGEALMLSAYSTLVRECGIHARPTEAARSILTLTSS